MKKILAMVLVLCMCLSLGVTAFAGGEPDAVDTEGDESFEKTETAAYAADFDAAAEEASVQKEETPVSEGDPASPVTDGASSGTCGDSLTWTLDSAGTLTISGTGDMTDYDPNRSAMTVNTPWYDDRNDITSLVLEEGVTSIGYLAFCNCSNLTSVTLPKSLTVIHEYAFSGCVSLTSVSYGGTLQQWIDLYRGNTVASRLWGVTVATSDGKTLNPRYGTCGDNLYWTLEDGTLTIHGTGDMTGFLENSTDDTFPWGEGSSSSSGSSGSSSSSSSTGTNEHSVSDDHTYSSGYFRTGVSALVVENGVTGIRDGAFADCAELTSVSLPDSLTAIGSNAFAGCTGITEITIPDSVKSLGDYAFYNCAGLESVSLGSSLTTLGRSVFSGCSALTGVTIPGKITSVSEFAFYGCSSLAAVTIPDSVTSIGEAAFYGCSSLTGVTIPNSVKTISDDAFDRCSALTEITIPDSVTSIGNWAFYRCTGLTAAEISGSGNTTVGDYAFYECTSLKNVTMDGVSSIGISAFWGCNSLSEITIPASVTEIGSSAFAYCLRLTKITFEGDSPIPGGSVFPGVVATAYYPADNDTWTQAIMNAYGGTISWVAYSDPDDLPASAETGASVTVEISPDGTVVITVTGFAEISQVVVNGSVLNEGSDYTAEPIAEGSAEGSWAISVFSSAMEDLGDPETLDVSVAGVDTYGNPVSADGSGSTGNTGSDDSSSGGSSTGNTGSTGSTDDSVTGVDPDVGSSASDTHTPGDINDDGRVNISDVQTLLKYVNGQDVPVNEFALDVNGDGTVNISDVQTLLKSVNGQDITIT